MIKGIGIDTADIRTIEEFIKKQGLDGPFVTHTYTEKEQKAAKSRSDASDYLAARFAAKEAVFKAVAPLLPPGRLDFRIVETLNRDDGSPYISITPTLKPILEEAGISTLLISITTESHYASAFVIASDD